MNPFRELLIENRNKVHGASLGKFEPIDWNAEINEELLEDMVYFETLKDTHERNARWMAPYDIESIRLEYQEYKRLFDRYNSKYENIRKELGDLLDEISADRDEEFDFTTEERKIIADRKDDLIDNLLVGMPARENHIENDPELSQVYSDLYDEIPYIWETIGEDITRAKDIASDMYDISVELTVKPDIIKEWEEYIKHDYQISSSDLKESE